MDDIQFEIWAEFTDPAAKPSMFREAVERQLGKGAAREWTIRGASES